ncbi:MAG: zinc ribbon domain-containing protein [Erysipelotrichaceae bacterium]|nr:zinc ribbon domain-containing protein [Erysipelotrichaceae bacterium]
MKECKHCKTLNPDDFIYCMNCGRKLPKNDVSEKGNGPISIGLNKKSIAIIAAVLLLLAGGIYLLTHTKGKSDYYLSRNQIQFIDGEKGVYLFEGSVKKADLPEVTADATDYGFDKQVLAIKDYTADTDDLYVYSKGKVDQVTDDVDRFEVSDSGETLYYTAKSDGSVHLYQIRNKKDNIVFDAENEESYDEHVLSYSGKMLAYTTNIDGETKLYVYSSSGHKFLPANDVSELLAVSEKGEVYYYNSDGHLMVCDGKKTSTIIESNILVCSNIDNSQLMAWGEEEFVLYENGRVRHGTYNDSGSFSNIVLPEKILLTGYMNFSGGSVYNMFYHLGVGDLKKLYYIADSTSIVRLNNNLKVETICENVSSYYVLSSDGKTLIWKDLDDAVHRFNGSSNTDFDCGEKRVMRLLSWDEKNKILYFVNNSTELCYSDGKSVTVIEENDPDIFMYGSDGYFYYKDGKTLKAFKKGGEVIEVGETNSSGSTNGKQDFFAKDGIGYEGSDKEFYFVKNAQAVKLATGEEVKES